MKASTDPIGPDGRRPEACLASATDASQREPATRRQILAASLGNALEWYDFTVYGAQAARLGRVVFSSSDPERGLLQSYVVLACLRDRADDSEIHIHRAAT